MASDDSERVLHNGHSDGLQAVSAMDVAANSSMDDLLKEFAHTGFGGRRLGEAADVLEAMIGDKNCFVVATLSGAMTVAKMGLVLCEMIDRGWINAIVSTGALMAHGLVEGTGRTHFKYDPSMDDVELYKKGYDRVYDTLELESNLDEVELVLRAIIETLPEDEVLSSHTLMHAVGKHLDETLPPSARGVLRSAYKKGVPVYVPAFTDSELGLDLEVLNQMRLFEGKKRRAFDPFMDLYHYGSTMYGQKSHGIFTIGGGVPRNWAQQMGPMMDLFKRRMNRGDGGFRFKYATRICPEPVHWGGLSGCTYSEGISWGKFIPPAEGGRFAEVFCDATIAWPLLVRGMIERFPNGVKKELAPRGGPLTAGFGTSQ